MVTTIVGSVWLGAKLDFTIMVGSTIVVLAVFNYFDEGGHFVSSQELKAQERERETKAKAGGGQEEAGEWEEKEHLMTTVSVKVQQ